MAKLGDFAASTTTTIQVNYLPQFIFIPDVTSNPTKLQVDVLGAGTIVNLDEAGIQVMNFLNAKGSVTNGILIQVSNGLIPNKTVDITITNAVAGTISAYGFNPDGRGNAYAMYEKNTVLAGSGFTFDKFGVVGFDSPTATDIFNVVYADGTEDSLSVEELEAYLPYFQNNNPVSEGLMINNTAQQYKKVQLIPSTNRTCYKLSYKPV
jgi:hypothetical protein